ncbi:MAG TPA: hypothetical protein VMF59_13720 [Bacteroidota bacterium]|nr:hypothetical protein [Bacteroidota bacterium]
MPRPRLPLTDLFLLSGTEPPAGDLGIRPGVSACRSVWTSPIAGEEGSPARRIIHGRTLRLHAPARLHRLGVAPARGYHKCGSRVETDWVTDLRVLLYDGRSWRVILRESGLPAGRPGERRWFDLGGAEAASAFVEIRRSGIDGWWPSWNLAAGAFVLEGEPSTIAAPRGELSLEVSHGPLSGIPAGLSASYGPGEVRYRSRYMEIGFRLSRAGFSYLALDDEGNGRTEKNLLWMNPGITFQGIFLHPLDSAPAMAPSIRYQARGKTRVAGNTVTYELASDAAGERYMLRWEVLEDRLRLQASREGEREIRAWESSAWTTGLDERAAASASGGHITREGETGMMTPPVFVHAPGHGTFDILPAGGGALWRADAVRPASLGIHQIKLGETPAPEGDYILHPGRHEAALEFVVRAGPKIGLRPGTPHEIVRAVDRCAITSLTYRPDTGTLSNNGNSMHCPLSMDTWSALTVRIGRVYPSFSAVDLLRDSIERWLDGAPGYGSGMMFADGEMHPAEDEYLMTGTASLLAVAGFLEDSGSPAWLEKFGPQLSRQIALMRKRDVDGDGLVESRYRLGISGDYQWSTCFYDVISFGWKCAFSNALLYPALMKLGSVLPRLGRPDLSAGLVEWGSLLRGNYVPAFFNPATGWLAGWKSRDGEIHDYAFLTVNAAAVSCGLLDDAAAREVMERLWAEAGRVGMPDPLYGIPSSLRPVPDKDLPEIMHGFPFGYYANGGLSTAHSRHVVNALYRVGMTEEADRLLARICTALGAGLVFGGAGSGLDARSWDGWPCGYEGLLTDQFGILATAMERYAPP